MRKDWLAILTKLCVDVGQGSNTSFRENLR
jgi:hypothetical protein